MLAGKTCLLKVPGGYSIRGAIKETEVQNYFFTKGIKKHDEFKNDIKSF